MRIVAVLLVLAFAAVAFSGCTEPRDIESEAKEREEWAREHNEYRPVAVLTGPATVAPGALVWYSAHGSHDPDFFGAREADDREEGRSAGGVHHENDASDVHWTWYVSLDADGNDGLGNGVRWYEWSIDGGRPLIAHELTHRYGSEDGPVRFPVGFAEPGTHTLRLTVVDWSGERDTITTTIEVIEGGTASTVSGWSVTEQGWVHEHVVPVSAEQYGQCPLIGRDHYDPNVHRVSVPWDLFFFMGTLQVEARWDAVEPPVAAPTQPSLLPDLTTPAVTPKQGLNLNDVGLTLGHCDREGAWAVFDTDQSIMATDLVETGEVPGEEAATNVEITGAKTERRGEWDINVFLSDSGEAQWGKGGDVRVRTIFIPALDTSYGGQ